MMIWPRDSIVFDKRLRVCVHASCAITQRRAILSAAGHARIPQRPPEDLPEGLRQSTMATYTSEWRRYISFATSVATKVPGRDVQWDPFLLWSYMRFRSRTCKPSTVISSLSALSHFGTTFGWVLPTTKYDGDALLHRQISRMKKQLSLNAPVGGHCSFAPERSTPLGNGAVSLMLSAFAVKDERSFRALPREHRHHLFASVVQCNSGMRFGHFIHRRYTIDSFTRDVRDGSWRLVTDWHRYSGLHRYCLEFAAFPRWRAQRFDLYDGAGQVTDTISAATLMHWHFRQLRDEKEEIVFSPQGVWPPSRSQRQTWIREVLRHALPPTDHVARDAIDDATPHSFRPGVAGDLYREGATLTQIAVMCRWHSMQAVRLYVSRMSLTMLRTTKAFRRIDTGSWGGGAPPTRHRITHDKE